MKLRASEGGCFPFFLLRPCRRGNVISFWFPILFIAAIRARFVGRARGFNALGRERGAGRVLCRTNLNGINLWILFIQQIAGRIRNIVWLVLVVAFYWNRTDTFIWLPPFFAYFRHATWFLHDTTDASCSKLQQVTVSYSMLQFCNLR